MDRAEVGNLALQVLFLHGQLTELMVHILFGNPPFARLGDDPLAFSEQIVEFFL